MSDDRRHLAESGIEDVASEREDLDSSPPKYEVVTYPADFTLEGLVQKYRRGQITIPGFQRKFVWSLRQATRLAGTTDEEVVSGRLERAEQTLFTSRERHNEYDAA